MAGKKKTLGKRIRDEFGRFVTAVKDPLQTKFKKKQEAEVQKRAKAIRNRRKKRSK